MSSVRIPSQCPQTPGPRSLHQIQDDARDRFAGIIWIQKDADRTTDDYFVDYDFWHPYSETTHYSKRVYQATMNGILRDYTNYLCILHSDDHEDEYYVVAKRMKNELESLEPYCPCFSCQSSICNPLKYVWCPHCTRCIKAGPHFAKREYIEAARLAKEESQMREPTTYELYYRRLKSVKVLEATMAGIGCIFGLYYMLM